MKCPESSLTTGGRAGRPLVSVVIPTRNRAECLPRALDSVYRQEGLGELFDLEVIVVDDASSDTTREVVESYPGVRYFRLPERRGVSAATNVALRASHGCYITFLDDDDTWLTHKLRTQVPILTAHPDIGVLYSQSLVRTGDTEELYPDAGTAPSGRIFVEMLMTNFASHHASLLVRRAAFDKAGYFDETLASHVDWDMSLRLAFHVPFLFLPGAVDVYNLSPQGLWLTRAASGMGRGDAARVIENALQLLPDSPEYAEIKRQARARVMLNVVYPLTLAGDLAQARATVIATLRAHPWILRHDWARSAIGHVAGKLALSSPSAVLTTRQFCAELRSAVPHRAAGEGRNVRGAVGAVWSDAAYALASSDAARDREAAYAAALAVVTMPSLVRRAALLRYIVRGVLGRRADAFCAALFTGTRTLVRTVRRSPRERDLPRSRPVGASAEDSVVGMGHGVSTAAPSHDNRSGAAS
jgi:hypothetical protein